MVKVCVEFYCEVQQCYCHYQKYCFIILILIDVLLILDLSILLPTISRVHTYKIEGERMIGNLKL